MAREARKAIQPGSLVVLGCAQRGQRALLELAAYRMHTCWRLAKRTPATALCTCLLVHLNLSRLTSALSLFLRIIETEQTLNPCALQMRSPMPAKSPRPGC